MSPSKDWKSQLNPPSNWPFASQLALRQASARPQHLQARDSLNVRVGYIAFEKRDPVEDADQVDRPGRGFPKEVRIEHNSRGTARNVCNMRDPCEFFLVEVDHRMYHTARRLRSSAAYQKSPMVVNSTGKSSSPSHSRANYRAARESRVICRMLIVEWKMAFG